MGFMGDDDEGEEIAATEDDRRLPMTMKLKTTPGGMQWWR